MRTKYPLFTFGILFLSLGMALSLASVLRADSSSVTPAFKTALQGVNPDLQTKVVSLYGMGTPAAIQKWYVIFYDPSVSSHGRAVLVQNGQITKTYEANGGITYVSDLTFDPSRITDEGPALSAAQTYAGQHSIAYDSVRALLKQNSTDQPLRWRVELLESGKSRGYVFVNTSDNSFASYQPAPTSPTGTDTAQSASDAAQGFAHTVKKTFLGIGGDLEQFFTGERTVDQ